MECSTRLPGESCGQKGWQWSRGATFTGITLQGGPQRVKVPKQEQLSWESYIRVRRFVVVQTSEETYSITAGGVLG